MTLDKFSGRATNLELGRCEMAYIVVEHRTSLGLGTNFMTRGFHLCRDTLWSLSGPGL